MENNAVIETTNLSKRFGVVTAVDQLNLTICQGEIFGFLGHNGAGKTTTIRLLNGVLEPNGGAARVLNLTPLADGPTLRQRTGVLTETPSLDERLTGRENLAIYADLYGVPPQQAAECVAELLATFDLSDRAEEKVSGYSKGMKQRLALARALLHQPEILFLDEPTSGLDPVATRQVHRLITRLSREQGRTIFICTHNLAEAQQLCDRVGVMENGRLLAIGTPVELMRQMQQALRLELEVAASDWETVLNQIDRMGLTAENDQGNGRWLISGAQYAAIPDLLAGLVQAGARVYRLNPQEPTLADVYFALHKEEKR
ncbi:MAG: ABC transporter ATP-binding protein [Chloroflexota bacterium]